MGNGSGTIIQRPVASQTGFIALQVMPHLVANLRLPARHIPGANLSHLPVEPAEIPVRVGILPNRCILRSGKYDLGIFQ